MSIISNNKDKIDIKKDPPQKLLQIILKKSPEQKECGAEINTIHSLIKQNRLSEYPDRYIYLVHPDTDEGRFSADVLHGYFKNLEQIKFHVVEKREIKNLIPSNEDGFKEGLKNLVKEVAGIVQRDRRIFRIAICASGGFKPQIAFVTIMGQAFRIPVFYMNKMFEEAIELSPLPVDWDMSKIKNVLELAEIIKKSYHDEHKLPLVAAKNAELIRLIKSDPAQSLAYDTMIEEKNGVLDLTPFGELLYYKFKGGIV
jgi:putative CRISPR-associated protein (TIGR02619 family)